MILPGPLLARPVLLVIFAFTLAVNFSVQGAPTETEVRIVALQGQVSVLPQNTTTWIAAQTNQLLHAFDRIRSDANSRVALRWSTESVLSFGASTELEILPPNATEDQPGLHLIRGILSFFHRDQPGHIRIITRGAVAGVEGTEFALAVDDADTSTLSVVDGKVRFGNDQATLLLTNGQQAIAALGQAPARTAGFIANNLLQWCFYYPAVLDPDELTLSDAEKNALADSLAAYRSGDLLAALKKYPTAPDTSNAEKIYHAAVLLAVGDVADTEKMLGTISASAAQPAKLGAALRQLIAAVKRQPSALSGEPKLASELLADSYFQQAQAVREKSLAAALKEARQATATSPKFGFAWERVAELEFSFGHTHAALEALDHSLVLAPNNAQALALKGYILSASSEPRAARDWFSRAIAADPALGNAWLGRGLARIRLGDRAGGREDLLIAAALEPQRAELRSYLGKAYAIAGDDVHATKELTLAKKLDPNDPTAWLYSALQNQQANRINDSIRDLEKSQSLNDNRSVYRSQLLLDEDSAVRSVNLAWMYQDAGMSDWARIQAGRAVTADYANYSAHLFLGNSYNELRDPNWANLRYEAPANIEFWLANLLAPTSAGWLSTSSSELQPYSRMFDQNRVGVVSDTTYMDRAYKGQPAWHQMGAQFGTYDQLSYSVQADYTFDPGQRPNEKLDKRDLNAFIKYQITPQDSAFVGVEQEKILSGDLNEYYNQASANGSVTTREKQWPNLFAGYHHEWSPGVHTVFFTTYGTADTPTQVYGGELVGIQLFGIPFDNVATVSGQEYLNITPTEYTTELQQIWETPKHTTVVGGRYAWGDINFQEKLWNAYPDDFPDASGGTQVGSTFLSFAQNITDNFQHGGIYAYHNWQIFDPLTVSAGLTYDYLNQPADVNMPPFSSQMKTTKQFSPKAGLVWTPLENTTFRAAYTRSLSGFINDSSIRIEPTTVAGFNQAYRTLTPYSFGDTSGSTLDTIDASLEQKFDTGTYLALSGELLYSKLHRFDGAFYWLETSDYITLSQPMRRYLDYCEKSLQFSADQLIGKQWTVGGRYRISQASLNSSFVDVDPAIINSDPQFPSSFVPRNNYKSLLHTVTLHANWNHPSGLFSILEADWYHQSNTGFASAEPGDDFWQLNLTGGWRFWHRRAEISGGILNLTDQNYSLEPLNLYNEMAHRRTFFVRLLVSF